MVSDMEYPIEGKALTKVFRDFWGRPKVRAVTEVDLQVRRGRVLGLLGPNGAGKSTLMKLILGHLFPTSGRLTVFGKHPRDVESKSHLGYLPERAYLYKHLTPVETLHFFGEILELPRDVIRSRTDQLIEMVGLGRARKRLVGEFSHGMGRRMGLAQALLNDPDLLLLDEPTAGLDPLGCRDVKDLILTMAKRGKTVLLTSHLLADVEDVCDELLILYGGRVQACGPARELLAQRDRLQITVPAADETKLAQLRQSVLETVGDKAEFGVPTRNLENYFLDIVRHASRTHETQGAQLGAGVAEYLQQEPAASPPPSTATPTAAADPAAAAAKSPAQKPHAAAEPPAEADDTPVPAADISSALAEEKQEEETAVVSPAPAKPEAEASEAEAATEAEEQETAWPRPLAEEGDQSTDGALDQDDEDDELDQDLLDSLTKN